MAGPSDLTGPQLGYFGAIQAAARVHATTAETWEAIRGQAATTGTTLPGGMFTAVNVMRGLAVGLRNSAEALSSAASSDAITGAMIGRQPYAQDLVGDLAPGYDVRFQVAMTYPDGVTQDEWFVRRYSAGLPATVGSLMDELNDYADALTQRGASGEGASAGEISAVEVGWF